MSIDPALLAAYADGELGPEQRAEVEAAIAADPALAKEVEAHRALRATLSAHFAPILDMPVPDRLKAPLERRADVVDLAEMRRTRKESARPRAVWPRWATGMAVAASLAIGIVVGGQIPGRAPVRSDNGALLASGALEKALTAQLASAAAEGGGPIRILLSFRARDGAWCRGFVMESSAGIACRERDGWAIARLQAGSEAQGEGVYRQAGSAEAEIMAAAQDMASGPALDAEAESAARDSGWRR